MLPLPKALALASAAGALIADAATLLVLQAQATPVSVPIAAAAGLIGGIVGAAVVWGAYKQKVDELERKAIVLDERKADRDALDKVAELLKEVREDVKWIVRHKGGDA